MNMASIISHFANAAPFSLLFLFSLAFLVQTLNLHPPDGDAVVQIHADLGIRHFPARQNICNTAGILCQQHLDINSTYILRVTRLLLDSQHLQGRLSPAIGDLSELTHLSLHNNKISGQIPPQIIHCLKLETLNLGKNLFSGRIPPKLSSLSRLRILDLSSNKFTGSIEFLKYFPNLERLNLADNAFSGEVPVSLRSFPNLRFIDVSGNSLLQRQLPLLTRDHLSYDLLENARLPARYVFAETPQRQNQSLAVAPSPSHPAIVGASPPTSAPKSRHAKNKKRIVQAILGFLAGIVAGGISGLVFTLLFKLVLRLIRGRKKGVRLNIFSPMIKGPDDLAFLEMDDGLSSLAIIGRGGCGEVYKAVLPNSNGKEIAIKKIIQPFSQMQIVELTEDSKLLSKKMRQMNSEIQTMGRIRHRNLLSLLAHLPRPNCHFLIYEYMKNGSLQDCLQQVAKGTREVEWPARYKIALGVATGLEHLHMNQRPRIIHRDLKPGNVLLDDDMEARIADFGLAKAVPDADTHVTSSNVAGTVGYIAPEYYQTFKFTDKCDVYSFGVVLGALVTGKLPSDEFFRETEEMNLVGWMRRMMASEEPVRAIDPKLLGKGFEEQMVLVLKVACFCTLKNPKERPDSKDARCMLAQITD